MEFRRLMGDFETSQPINDEVFVWASCLVDIDSLDVVQLTNSIDNFFAFIGTENTQIYFHNEKFDGSFIVDWLLRNGYSHVSVDNDTKETKIDSKGRKKNVLSRYEFETLIDNMGTWYEVKIRMPHPFSSKKRDYITVKINDSLKKIPLPVKRVAKAFGTPMLKGEIDHKKIRQKGHIITEEEKKYVIDDCLIVATALRTLFNQGFQRLTASSDALAYYKGTLKGKGKDDEERFRRIFPMLDKETDAYIRQSYKGGYTYVNKSIKGKKLGKGVTYDVNSLYPSVMYNKLLPYGRPVMFTGEYEQDDEYPLYICRIRTRFYLKDGYTPIIQLKNNIRYMDTEYLERSEIREEFYVTSVDLELIKRHYRLLDFEVVDGLKFKAQYGLFKDYIDHWTEIKIASDESGNDAMKQIAKLMLNSLYGKFATSVKCAVKIPRLENDVVKFSQHDSKDKDMVYTAMGCFITAYSRETTIVAIEQNYDRFLYCDTDSIHLRGWEEPTNIDIHKNRLGAWKCEGFFDKSKFLRAKTYMEHVVLNGNRVPIEPHWEIKCAGMPDNVKKQVTFDNFKSGAIYTGKLVPKRVKGGLYLKETEFSIG